VGYLSKEFDPVYVPLLGLFQDQHLDEHWGPLGTEALMCRRPQWAGEKDLLFEQSIDRCPCGGTFRMQDEDHCPKGHTDVGIDEVIKRRITWKPYIVSHYEMLKRPGSLHPFLKEILEKDWLGRIPATFSEYIDGGCPRYWFKGRLEKGKQEGPRERFQVLMRIGIHRGAKGNLEGALKNFDEALKLRPEESKAWYYKGKALHEKKDQIKALECLNKALELDPTFTDAMQEKGCLLGEMERFDEAISIFETVIKLNEGAIDGGGPETARVIGNIGSIYFLRKDYKKAEEFYRTALSFYARFGFPGNSEALGKLKALLKMLGREGEPIEIKNPDHQRLRLKAMRKKEK
jgi:tetratricopeptide (TPR) repeat protein